MYINVPTIISTKVSPTHNGADSRGCIVGSPSPITSKRERAARARTIAPLARPGGPISRRRRLFRKVVTQTVLNLGLAMDLASAVGDRCVFNALKRRRGLSIPFAGFVQGIRWATKRYRTLQTDRAQGPTRPSIGAAQQAPNPTDEGDDKQRVCKKRQRRGGRQQLMAPKNSCGDNGKKNGAR
jgi:hypothetical protein